MRAPGAPPGHRMAGRGPPGKGPGAKPGFGPRPAAWVAVGSTSVTVPSASSSSGGATGEAKSEPIRRAPPKIYEQSEIAPTAQSMAIDPLNLSHPMTLPFLDPVKANPTLKANVVGDVDGISSRLHRSSHDLRASSTAIDPTSIRSMGTEAEKINPANMMFRNEDGRYEGEDQLFFIQMPTALPLGDIPSRPSSAAEQSQVLGFKSNLSSLPSGHIGKLVIYKSGKVKLRIGDLYFDVSTGMPCNFLQEVVAINPEKKKCFQLGDISRRMVCYPDIEHLLENGGPQTQKEEVEDQHSMDFS
jgi:hypothetical protein